MRPRQPGSVIWVDGLSEIVVKARGWYRVTAAEPKPCTPTISVFATRRYMDHQQPFGTLIPEHLIAIAMDVLKTGLAEGSDDPPSRRAIDKLGSALAELADETIHTVESPAAASDAPDDEE